MTTTQTADDSSMTEITTIEFESSTFGNSYVSELEDGPPYTVHGIALGSGDVTVGASGIKKKWPATELEEAADSLKGTNLVVDHDNDATGVVGRVTKAGYKEETGVVYEAELYDEDLAEKVKNGLLEVSIRGYHADVDALEEDDDTGAKVVEDIKFDNLSIVPTGAAPSNTLEMGEHAELSAAELSAFTDELEAAELQEIEPGMWVTTGDTNGITISAVEDGEIEVDIYEESDGSWRSTGETEMFDTGSLDEWDVDEDDIEAREEEDEDEDEEEEENSSDELETYSDYPEAAKENAQMALDAREETGNPNDCGTDVGWERANQLASGESLSRDTIAKMSAFNRHRSNSEMSDEEGESDCGWMMWKAWGGDEGVDWAQKKLDSIEEENESDIDAIDAPEWEEGQMVQWQVNPDMMGKIVHVDTENQVLMVEIMEEENGELISSGHTIGALYSDVVEVDRESMGVTTKNAPTQDVEPSHEPMGADDESDILDLFKKFMRSMEENEQASLKDFSVWLLESEELYKNERGEAEEERIRSKNDLQNSREKDPKWLDSELEELALEDVDSNHRFNSKEEAEDWVDENMDDLDGVHKMGSVWVPGDTHEEYMDKVASASGHMSEEDMNEDEEASADEGESVSDESDVEELQEYEMHTPDWSGTTESDWSSPDMEDFDTDDLSEIANHFLISSSGFPPENFTDLKLPVVEPNGDLNVNALAAVKGGRGVTAVDGLGSDMEQEIVDWVNSTANEEFDRDWGNEEEENTQADAHEIGGTSGRSTPGENTVGGVRVLSGDDLRQLADKPEESDADSLTTYKVTNMTESIEEKLSELENPVAVEEDEVEELRDKADQFEELSENIEALRERTEVLDEVDRSQVEELAESEDALVVESARYEELQEEAEQVKGVYAASLAEEYPAFSAEELTDKFSIEELREKFEDEVGEVEDELTANPRSQDADEESLEDASSSEEESSEEELSDEIQDKQAEIRDKILGGD